MVRTRRPAQRAGPGSRVEAPSPPRLEGEPMSTARIAIDADRPLGATECAMCVPLDGTE